MWLCRLPRANPSPSVADGRLGPAPLLVPCSAYRPETPGRHWSGPSCLRTHRWLQPWHTELQENAWPRSIQVSCRFNAHTCPRVPVSATLIRTEFEGDEPVCCGQGAAVFEHGDHFAWRDRAELMVAHASFARHLCAANGMCAPRTGIGTGARIFGIGSIRIKNTYNEFERARCRMTRRPR